MYFQQLFENIHSLSTSSLSEQSFIHITSFYFSNFVKSFVVGIRLDGLISMAHAQLIRWQKTN